MRKSYLISCVLVECAILLLILFLIKILSISPQENECNYWKHHEKENRHKGQASIYRRNHIVKVKFLKDYQERNHGDRKVVLNHQSETATVV